MKVVWLSVRIVNMSGSIGISRFVESHSELLRTLGETLEVPGSCGICWIRHLNFHVHCHNTLVGTVLLVWIDCTIL